MLSQETVADLNKQVTEEIPLNRFRPNIIVAGGEPWAEDRWQVCADALESDPDSDRKRVTSLTHGTVCF